MKIAPTHGETVTEACTNDDKQVMQTIVYDLDGDNDVKRSLRLRPDPGLIDRVLVRVHAVGLNPNDQKSVIGDKLPKDWVWGRARAKSYLQNKIVGFDFAGVVVEDHNSVFKNGDKVFGVMPLFEGSLAEYISVPLDQLCFVPKNFSFAQAAALPLAGLTALQSLSPCIRSPSHPTSVLIIGASGGTGHIALQVARNLGARHITAVCSASNKTFVESFGATHFVDYTLDDEDPDTLVQNLQEAPGCPFHVVLDCVTSNDPRDCVLDYPSLIRQTGDSNSKKQKVPLVTSDHQYVRLGGPSTDWILAGAEHICGLARFWPDKGEKLFWVHISNCAHTLSQLKEWAEDHQLKVCVSRKVSFTAKAVQLAFDKLVQRHVRGKIVVEVIPSEDATDDEW